MGISLKKLALNLKTDYNYAKDNVSDKNCKHLYEYD